MKTLREYKESVLSVLLEQERFQNTARAILGTTPVSTSALLEKLTQPDTTVLNIFDLDTEWETMSTHNNALTPLLYTLAQSKNLWQIINRLEVHLEQHFNNIRTLAGAVFANTDPRQATLKNADTELKLATEITTILQDPSMQAGWIVSKPEQATQLESFLKQLPTEAQAQKQAASLESLQKTLYKKHTHEKANHALTVMPQVKKAHRLEQQKAASLAQKLAALQTAFTDLQATNIELTHENTVMKAERNKAYSTKDKTVNAINKSIHTLQQQLAESDKKIEELLIKNDELFDSNTRLRDTIAREETVRASLEEKLLAAQHQLHIVSQKTAVAPVAPQVPATVINFAAPQQPQRGCKKAAVQAPVPEKAVVQNTYAHNSEFPTLAEAATIEAEKQAARKHRRA